MQHETNTYSGDAEYRIPCTGDVVVGDHVRFDRAVFSGSFRKPVFDGFERVTAEIIADSYGQAKQQHTFSLLLPDGTKILIKGRNLYRNGVWRKPWPDEALRAAALHEKHARGNHARRARSRRKGSYEARS
ncbi:MAG: hypothetical protein ING75_13745 [Rhodocyclaceae bacterium]|nr:hypothetical protein [Rhodocyclaceae bacterium]